MTDEALLRNELNNINLPEIVHFVENTKMADNDPKLCFCLNCFWIEVSLLNKPFYDQYKKHLIDKIINSSKK